MFVLIFLMYQKMNKYFLSTFSFKLSKKYFIHDYNFTDVKICF